MEEIKGGGAVPNPYNLVERCRTHSENHGPVPVSNYSLMFIYLFNNDRKNAYLVPGTMRMLGYIGKQDTGLTDTGTDK